MTTGVWSEKMGNQPASEQSGVRPTRLGPVEAGVPRTVGTGFTSLHFGVPVFGSDSDSLLMLDHFVMTGDTFAPHLHQNIATLTVLLEDSRGSLLNRDTVSGSVALQAGDLYRLAAGGGAVHEQSPAAGARIHALQLFVKLPCALHRTPPHASHLRRADVPVAEGAGYRVRTVLGAHGDAGTGTAANEMTLLDGTVEPGAQFMHRLARDRKAWLYVISGQLEMRIADGARMLETGQMTTVGAGQAIDVAIHAAMTTHFILIAVEPVQAPGAPAAALRAARPVAMTQPPVALTLLPSIEETT
jgi:redox-sensitive bicupin YhaK (pirin superfamily)